MPKQTPAKQTPPIHLPKKAPKKKMGKRGKAKLPIFSPVGSSQEENPAIEPSPKVNTSVDLETETMSRNSALETTIMPRNISASPTDSAPGIMTPASTASTKAERNRRKKENARKRKAEASQKEATEANLLAEISSTALYKKVLDSAGEGNPRSLPVEAEVGEQRSEVEHAGRLWKIKDSPGKGLGLFATQFIKKDTVIFQEAPLIAGGPQWLQKEASFMVLPEEKKRAYMSLYSYCKCQQIPCIETSFSKIYNANNFEVRDTGENAVYKVASRINHACIPNAFRRFTKAGNLVLLSTEDIKKGDEITLDYVGAGAASVSTRRPYLADKFGFYCRCKGCITNKKLSSALVEKRVKDLSIPVEVTTPEVLGEQSPEELAALAEVEPWFRSFQDWDDKMVESLKEMCVLDYVRGSDSRELLYDSYEEAFGGWLRKNNKFGLSEEVIRHHAAKARANIVPQMEDYIQRLKEYGEKQKTRPVS